MGEVLRGARYLAVGGFNVLFTLFLFWILDLSLTGTIGVQPVYWISAIGGIANGFLWQKLLVWRSKGRWRAEFAKFFLLNVMLAVVNSLLLHLTVTLWGYPAFPSEIAITSVLVVAAFFVNRFWVFRPAPAEIETTVDDLQEGPNRIDVFIQYYRPHISGLTNMAADIAEFAAARGWDVHVHCVSLSPGDSVSQINGVTVHAYRRTFSLARGVFSMSLIRAMWRMRHTKGTAHVHMPYPESFLLAMLLGSEWRVLSTYHCDAPETGGFATAIARALDASQRSFMRRSTFTVTSSEDYALHSRLAGTIASSGGIAIPATSVDRAGGQPTFAAPGVRYIGFLGRPTSEKGIDLVLEALESLPSDVHLLIAGPTAGLTDKLGYDRDKFSRLEGAGRIRSLGFLDDDDIANFYASLDLFLLPSTNSFEAFGIVQVEAMSAGVPVVASDLPGVRTIVQATHLGEIAAVGDAEELARCITLALETNYDVEFARTVLVERYLSPYPERRYMELYEQLLS